MNDALARHIGKRLRRRRRLLDLSQAALGADCGVSFQTIHKYEAGVVQISAAALYELAKAL
ncbi:MAG: helix-turn-helix transcriptional regulator, partial [Proteobacteria bacterium]|nr:helix-turn-helix transcriptional regulator [Pseudomonadota bacterium]